MDNSVNHSIQKGLKTGQIKFKKHALIRIIERNIKIYEVEEALSNHKIITEYPEDRPLKSYLLLGFTKNERPIHIVIAIEKDDIIWIITVYEPDKDKWNKSFTKKIKS